MVDTKDFSNTNHFASDILESTGKGQAPSSFEDIVGYFEKQHSGRFLVDREAQAVHWVTASDTGTYVTVVRWTEESSRLFIRIPEITRVPKDKRLAAAVLIDMINWQLAIGNFQMDHSDGELAFRASLAVKDGHLGAEQMETHFLAGVITADFYLPAFYRLFWGKVSPEEAFASVNVEDGE